MKKRITPQILIDRSLTPTYPHHHIFCDDGKYGFICQVQHITDAAAFREMVETEHSIKKSLYKGGVIIKVVKWVVDENSDKIRVKSLLKKILKKYLFGESKKAYNSATELNIDNQIKLIEETLRHNKANYGQLLDRSAGMEDLANFNIQLLEATLVTLNKVKDAKNRD